MILLVLVLILIVYWYYFVIDNEAGFHRGGWGRIPIRYDPSMYYDDRMDWYESPYIFFDRQPPFQRNRNQSYWECFELNKSIGANNRDAYRLCKHYID